MHATTAILRAGGSGRSPLSKLAAYDSAVRRSSSVVLIGENLSSLWCLLEAPVHDAVARDRREGRRAVLVEAVAPERRGAVDGRAQVGEQLVPPGAGRLQRVEHERRRLVGVAGVHVG